MGWRRKRPVHFQVAAKSHDEDTLPSLWDAEVGGIQATKAEVVIEAVPLSLLVIARIIHAGSVNHRKCFWKGGAQGVSHPGTNTGSPGEPGDEGGSHKAKLRGEGVGRLPKKNRPQGVGSPLSATGEPGPAIQGYCRFMIGQKRGLGEMRSEGWLSPWLTTERTKRAFPDPYKGFRRVAVLGPPFTAGRRKPAPRNSRPA